MFGNWERGAQVDSSSCTEQLFSLSILQEPWMNIPRAKQTSQTTGKNWQNAEIFEFGQARPPFSRIKTQVVRKIFKQTEPYKNSDRLHGRSRTISARKHRNQSDLERFGPRLETAWSSCGYRSSFRSETENLVRHYPLFPAQLRGRFLLPDQFGVFPLFPCHLDVGEDASVQRIEDVAHVCAAFAFAVLFLQCFQFRRIPNRRQIKHCCSGVVHVTSGDSPNMIDHEEVLEGSAFPRSFTS